MRLYAKKAEGGHSLIHQDIRQECVNCQMPDK
jgi:hypothetical protein